MIERPRPGSVRAIILDVGSVILHERDHAKRLEWERRLGLPQGGLTRLVLDSEQAKHAASGQYSERQVWEAIAQKLGLPAEEIPQLQWDFWLSERLDVSLVEYIQSLRPRYTIAILSNAWSEARAVHEKRFGFSAWVDVQIYSAEVGLLKPDPRIYQLALSELKLAAHECVFVDDRLVNVQAAEAVGMNAVWCRETQQTIDDIQAYLDGRTPTDGRAQDASVRSRGET